LLLGAGTSLADPASPRSRNANSAAEALTRQLILLAAEYRSAERAAKPAIVDWLVAAAFERQRFLSSLIEEAPADVLRVALSAELRESLPAGARSYLEKHVSFEGELEVLYEDDEHTARLRYFLETGSDRFSLHFASDPPPLPSGARVRVEGVSVDHALAIGSGKTGVESLDLAAQPSAHERLTLLLLVNFSDDPTAQPYSVDEAWQTVFGTTSDFLLENSFGQTWLSGEVAGWYTLPLAAGCSSSQIAIAADAAAGIDPTDYDSVIYVFPRNPSCGWTGMATVGGAPGKVWINGRLELQVVGHELGHNYGLYHSHALECGELRTANDCQNVEYGDRLDVMGFSPAHLNAFQKERMAWMGEGTPFPITAVESEGTYLLDAYEADPGSGPKALKVLKRVDPATGARTWYYVEYRQAIGFDGFLENNANVMNGVLIRTASEASANSSFLLDMTPGSLGGTADFLDPALEAGESFAPPGENITITTQWVDGAQASVSISLVPEPRALLQLAAGVALLAVLPRRR